MQISSEGEKQKEKREIPEFAKTSLCNIPLPVDVLAKSLIPPTHLKEETKVRHEEKKFDDPNKYNDLQLDSLNPENEDIIDLHPGILETELNETSDKESSLDEQVPIVNTPKEENIVESKISLKLVSKPLLIRRPIDSSSNLDSNLKQVFENPSDYEENSKVQEEGKSAKDSSDKIENQKAEKKIAVKLEKFEGKSESRDNKVSSKRDKDSDSQRSKSPIKEKKRSPRKDRDKREGDDRGKSRGHYNDTKEKEKSRSDKERGTKAVHDAKRRATSPLCNRGRTIRGGSPWENERSRSRSKDRSRTRSFSPSPRRRDDSRDRDKKFEDDRFSKGTKFTSDRRDRGNRSPPKYKGNVIFIIQF